ncbi:MAG: Mth938-like domain-containing protein [Burkholderiales bacterium]|nr:Mth938-like domain-containing protein [Burkholderiales bacterium]
MKLLLTTASGQNIFTGYGPGYVSVNSVRHEKHIVVASDQVMEWRIENFDALSAEDFAFLLALKPEIVILGTGNALRFPPPALSRPLALAGIGLEVMDSKAACRTYNILAAEGRKVVAAVLIA